MSTFHVFQNIESKEDNLKLLARFVKGMSESLPFERVKRIIISVNTQYLAICNIQISQIPESILSVILLFYYNTIESSILTDKECDELLTLFEQKNVFKNVDYDSYKLLFKGTRDGFKADAFYENVI